MANAPTKRITLKLPGQRLDAAALPRALQPGLRAVGDAADDPFLPRGWVRAVETVDLSATARSIGGAGATQEVATASGQVLAIELADGVTVYTSPENLERTLAQLAPDAVADGTLDLTALETRAGRTRAVAGETAGKLVARVTTLDVGQARDAITEAAADKLRQWLGDQAGDALAQLGVSWWGTKALMAAIEDRHGREHGLYRWRAGEKDPATLFAPLDDPRLAREAAQGPALVFIHGTASSTAGSFGDLQGGAAATWRALEQTYGERIYALDHRSLSESPIDNALQLARALPAGARLHLVTHSRGGLVGDLMCLAALDTPAAQVLIESFAVDSVALGDVSSDERARLAAELERAYAKQRAALKELGAVLRAKRLVVERYVRVACPARGTRLASSNFDIFLSGLLSLIGLIPGLAGSPLYSAFKRVVLEIARNRTRPNLVPGIEAMLPGSPMALLLARAQAQADTRMAVIAGDIEGGGLLKRLGVLFTDHMFFDGVDNDLVVDTDSMSAGVARPERTRRLFDQGPDVNHFRYFTNALTRDALGQWLTASDPTMLAQFGALPALPAERAGAPSRAALPEAVAATLPVVVLLPGVMGSHLWLRRKDRVWLDPLDLLTGGLAKIRDGASGVEAEKLLDMSYGDLCDHLGATHRVERFAYDWRLPLDRLADALAPRLRAALDATKSPQRPVRVLAHSMGGLVVRALVAKFPDLWNELMARDGARFVMLGTPNHGSHQMVETLIGKSDTIRMLGRADLRHSLQEVLDIVAGFRGPLSLLPRPGFVDEAALGGGSGQQLADYFQGAVWARFKRELRDLWFGDGVVATPAAAVLTDARWLWDHGGAAPALPARHKAKVFYVHGVAARTACGIARRGDGRWQMLATPRGDGTVSWASGKLADGVAQYLYLPAEHGALADTAEYFGSIAALLGEGQPGKLMTSPPALRDVDLAAPALAYEAGAPVVPSEVELASALLARRPRPAARARAERVLAVQVRAMDLGGVNQPILVGHYEQDAISGAEAQIDRKLVAGALHQRYDLGLYAGALGTATVVLPQRNAMELGRGSRRGAVVTGLGAYDGTLGVAALTQAVHAGVVRLLLQLHEDAGAPGSEAEAGIALSSLLLGYNSSANLGIGDTVSALLRGVIGANRKFRESFGRSGGPVWEVRTLEIIEVYRDTAITATRSLQRVAAALNAERGLRCRVEAAPLLLEGEGVRERLEDVHTFAQWARLMIGQADGRGDDDAGADPAPQAATEPCADADEPAAAPAAAPRRADRGMRRALADRLRYLYLGSGRARVETVVQQRQPGLVERLVAQQLHLATVDPVFGRTLFQLMVPHDLKETMRQLERAVLVLDGYTANLPWEMMRADDDPLAVKAALVRQLSSTRFRARVREATEARALVIGNPSTEGFGAAFSMPGGRQFPDPDPLKGAEDEAHAVVDVLRQNQWEVKAAIGADQRALDIVNAMLVQPYRLLHIAAHGVVDLPHPDGRARSGVVLSDGLLITAAEIGAMEVVPELVFMNCCHLGQVDCAPALNKLAYSVARELIEIGVRAVVVAGWAVDDQAAALFARTLYVGLLEERKAFGDAVFAARRAVYDRMRQCTTWGAYQAYGDPGWRLVPRADDPLASAAAAPVPERMLVAPAELKDELLRKRRDLAQLGAPAPAADLQAADAWVQARLRTLQATGWTGRPDIATALGRLYGEMGAPYFERARQWYRAAIGDARDPGGTPVNAEAPIDAIEQLANLEAREGETRGDAAMVQSAIDRLTGLLRIAAGLDARTPLTPANADTNPERAGLLGSACKRLAALQARANQAAATAAALQAAAEWYRAVLPADLRGDDVDPYPGLNWLFLASFTPAPGTQDERVAFARRCAALANARFAATRDAWAAIMPADAALAEALLKGSLADAAGRDAEVERLAQRYRDAMTGVAIPPKTLDSTLQQMRLLALFHRVRAGSGRDTADSRAAESLERLAAALEPSGPDAPHPPVKPPSRKPAAAPPLGVPEKAAKRPAKAKPSAKTRRRG